MWHNQEATLRYLPKCILNSQTRIPTFPTRRFHPTQKASFSSLLSSTTFNLHATNVFERAPSADTAKRLPSWLYVQYELLSRHRKCYTTHPAKIRENLLTDWAATARFKRNQKKNIKKNEIMKKPSFMPSFKIHLCKPNTAKNPKQIRCARFCDNNHKN